MPSLVLACVALALSADADPGHAREVCSTVAMVAPVVDLDPYLIAAVAWHESRFDPGLVSRSGCLGPMQVNPAWSPYSKQELATADTGTLAGIYAALYWRSRRGDRWLHCYASGEDCRAVGYVRQVKRTRRKLARWARELEVKW